MRIARVVAVTLAVVGASCSTGRDPREATSRRDGLIVSSELVTPEVTLTRAIGSQLSPWAASRGDHALVVWADGRLSVSQNTNAIFGARFDLSQGSTVDPAGLRVMSGSPVDDVVVASDGQRYLVVWHDPSAPGIVSGQRVLRDGGLEGPRVRYSSASSGGRQPALDFDGQDFLLSFVEGVMGEAVLLRIEPVGGATRSSVRLPVTGANDVAIGALPSSALVLVATLAADGGRTGELILALPDGGVSAAGTLALPVLTPRATALTDAGTFFVAWAEDATLRAMRVDRQGVRIDATPLVIANSPTAERGLGQVTDLGDEALVAWIETPTPGNGEVLTRRFDVATGAALPDELVSSNGLAREVVAVTRQPGTLEPLFAWQEVIGSGFSSNDDIFAAQSLGGRFLLSAAAQAQVDADLAVSDGQALLAWRQYGLADSDVRVRSLSLDGGVWQSSSVPFAFASADETSPDVALGAGGTALAVFANQADVRGGRFSATGPLDPAGLNVCGLGATQSTPAVTFDGTTWWTGWIDHRTMPTQLYVSRISSAGARLDGDGRPVNLNIVPTSLSAARGPNGVVFASHDLVGEVRYQRVFLDGGLEATPQNLGLRGRRPALAFDGVTWLTALEVSADGGGELVTALQLSPGPFSAMGAPFTVHTTGDSNGVDVVFDGVHFVVAWVDSPGDGGPQQVLLRRVASSGALVDPAPISLGVGEFRRVELASQGRGRTVAALTRFSGGGLQAWRAAVVVIDETTYPGTPCNTAVDCPGLECVDGVCCNQTCGGGAPDDCLACSRDAGASVDGVCELKASGQSCRPSSRECDVAEVCSGTDSACPVDRFAADLSSCSAGVCLAGACTPDGGAGGGAAGGAAGGGSAVAGGSAGGGSAGGGSAGGGSTSGGSAGGGSAGGGSAGGSSAGGGSGGGSSAGGGSTGGGAAGGSPGGGEAGGNAGGSGGGGGNSGGTAGGTAGGASAGGMAPAPVDLRVGCGCTQLPDGGAAALAWWLVLHLTTGRRRRSGG